MSQIMNKYICPICQCIFEDPAITIKCFHLFCFKCIKSFIDNKLKNNPNLTKFECPICRQEFEKDDYVLAYDLKVEIENCKIKCKCGIEIPISSFDDHQNNCILNIKKDDGTIIGGYNCTLCTKTNMNREEYVKHIESQHSDEEGVCAICSVQPWGDKNYKTYLLGHVDLRHRKRDISLKDENKEEMELIKRIMELSLKEK